MDKTAALSYHQKKPAAFKNSTPLHYRSHIGNKTPSCRRSHAAKNFALHQKKQYKHTVSKQQLHRGNKRNARIAELPTYFPSFDRKIECDKQTFFCGGLDLSCKFREGSTVHPVSILHLIDTINGARMEDVFTLVPRNKVMGICNKKTFRAFDTLESQASTNLRSGERITMFEGRSKYVTFGAHPRRFGSGVSDSIHGMNQHPEAYEEIARYYRQCEHVAKQYIASDDMYGFYKSKQLVEWKSFPLDDTTRGELWSSISVGRNVFLNAHTDIDFWLSMTTVVCKGRTELNAPVANYFCFPQYGVAVALRPGDLLIFNPQTLHCVSSRRTTDDVFCISFYLKTAVVGGHSNGQRLTEKQDAWADRKQC